MEAIEFDVFEKHYYVVEELPVQGNVTFDFTSASDAQEEIRKALSNNCLVAYYGKTILKHVYLAR